MLRSLALGSLALAACGRGNFDRLVDAVPDAAPPVLSCTAPQFSIGDASLGFAAIATQRGYDVFAVDGSGMLVGSAYAFDTSNPATVQLVTEVSDKLMHADVNGQLAVVAIGDDVLVAAGYGKPPVGTELLAFDAQLEPRATVVPRDGVFGTAGSLARNRNGALVFAGQPSLQKVELQAVSPLGVDVAGTPPATVNEGGNDLNNPSVLAVDSKFLAVWNAPGSPSVVHAQLFDEQLASPSAVPVQVSPTQMTNTEFPRAAYAQAADRYLIAWHQKAAASDEVWFSLRDGALGEIKSERLVARGVFPAIVAGDSDFLVVWQDGSMQPRLSGARITMDGTVSYVAPDSGATAAGWSLVTHNGQPALIWVEAGSTRSTLWLDPLCP